MEALAQRLQAQRYRATLVRRCDMPKANGQDRPLGIPAREDPLVPLACATRLTASSAQDVLAGRDGYRPGRGALDAVRDLPVALQYGRYGSRVAADLQGFFDPMDHAWLLAMLRVRSDDRALLKLIRTWLQAGGWRRMARSSTLRPGPPTAARCHPSWQLCACTRPWTSGLPKSSRPPVGVRHCCAAMATPGAVPSALRTTLRGSPGGSPSG